MTTDTVAVDSPVQATVKREFEETGHDEIVEVMAILYRLDIPYTLEYDGQYSFKLTMRVMGELVSTSDAALPADTIAESQDV